MKYVRWHRVRGPNANLLKEVKLVSNSGERDLYESLAEIYSIIVTLDGLEKAYIKDVVTEAEYTETCTRLLKQYKSSVGDESVSREFVDLETFKRTWGVCLLQCPLSIMSNPNPVGVSPRNRTITHRTTCDRRAGLTRRTCSQQYSIGWWRRIGQSDLGGD